jgi:hypothetical protein
MDRQPPSAVTSPLKLCLAANGGWLSGKLEIIGSLISRFSSLVRTEGRAQYSDPVFDKVAKLVPLDARVAITGLWIGAAVVTDNPIAGVAANPISWRRLDNGDEKRFAAKLAFFDTQISFKLGFFADWTDFWHGISLSESEGAVLGRPLPDGLVVEFTDWPCW